MVVGTDLPFADRIKMKSVLEVPDEETALVARRSIAAN
jgi:hypothetical protein